MNKMIYIGTNEYDEDIFLNFEDAGNIFVHGCPGMIKEQYLNTIYKMMKCEGSLGIVFWPFKPLELEPWCKDNLQEEAQGFSRLIKMLVNSKHTQTVVVIDGLDTLLNKISLLDKNWLTHLMGTRKENNINFICFSQNMAQIIDEFNEFATTRICLGHGINKEDSFKIIGDSKGDLAVGPCDAFVINKVLLDKPQKMKVIKKGEVE